MKNKKMFGFLGLVAVAVILGFSLFSSMSCEGAANEVEYCSINWALKGGQWEVGFSPTEQVVKGQKLSRPDDPTRAGYEFVNWFTDNAGLNRYYFSKAVQSDLILFAKWEKIPGIEYWDIDWELNGGDWPVGYTPTEQVVKGQLLSVPTNPTKADNTFAFWYTDAGLSTLYVFSQPVNKNLTLYAQWIPSGSTVEYWDITWNMDGGEWPAGFTPAAQVVKGQPLTAQAQSPAKSNYTFEGWYDVSKISEYTFPVTVTSDMTLYAKWEAEAQPQELTYLLFTSDVHWEGHRTNVSGYTNNGVFKDWMDNMKTVVPSVDRMCFLGDQSMSANNQAIATYWTGTWNDNATGIMNLADSYITSGFIKKPNIYILGNHEVMDPGSNAYGGKYYSNTTNSAAARITANHTRVVEDKYVIYVLGAIYTSGSGDGCQQQFAQTEINSLETYLTGQDVPTDRPLFVIAHHPIHSISSRVTVGRPDNLVNVLNTYATTRNSKTYFLWGHNHSQSSSQLDTNYDKVFRPGSKLAVLQNGGSSWSSQTAQAIQFTYLSAGAMTDIENIANKNGEYVQGKGLLAKIQNGEVTFTYYKKDLTPLVPTEVTN